MEANTKVHRQKNCVLLLYILLVVATHSIYVVMMLLNAFLKQTCTSEIFKQYTTYLVVVPRGGKLLQRILVVRFMVYGTIGSDCFDSKTIFSSSSEG